MCQTATLSGNLLACMFFLIGASNQTEALCIQNTCSTSEAQSQFYMHACCQSLLWWLVIFFFPFFLKALKIKCSNQAEQKVLEKQLPGKSMPILAVQVLAKYWLRVERGGVLTFSLCRPQNSRCFH